MSFITIVLYVVCPISSPLESFEFIRIFDSFSIVSRVSEVIQNGDADLLSLRSISVRS